ncbi:MAG: zinc-binding dehydrogenase [Verrucomicrobiota bacterium]
MKTKAIIFVQPKKVVYDDILLPDPTPRDITLRNEVSGISVGTERWTYQGKRAEIQFPNVPGYMGVGVVVSVGNEARQKGWNEGDRAYYFTTRFGKDLDGKSWMGSHVAEAVVDVCGPRAGGGDLEVHHCEKVPQGLKSEDAALMGLCAVAMRGIEMATIPVGAKVFISGLGVIGQYALQVANLKGAHVTAMDIADSRLEVAKILGASHIIHGKRENVSERASQIAPEGYDVIIDTSSVATVVNSLFPLLKMRGKFVFQGWYPPPTPLDLSVLHTRLPSAYFPCAHSAESVETALGWAQKGWIQSKDLITHVYAPEKAAEAYEMIDQGSDNFLGLIFDWRK